METITVFFIGYSVGAFVAAFIFMFALVGRYDKMRRFLLDNRMLESYERWDDERKLKKAMSRIKLR